jgi:hypothetical protein
LQGKIKTLILPSPTFWRGEMKILENEFPGYNFRFYNSIDKATTSKWGSHAPLYNL